jgi:EamA-like transporter family
MKAYLLGLLGVIMFGMTFPMTRLAVGTLDAPQLSPWFSAIGRAAVAGCLSLAYLFLTSQLKAEHRPKRGDWLPLSITAAGVVFGFPLLTAWALRYVESIHAAVLIGFLPLATAALGAWLSRVCFARQRFNRGLCRCSPLKKCFAAKLSLTFSSCGCSAGHGRAVRCPWLCLWCYFECPPWRTKRDLLGAGNLAAYHLASRALLAARSTH